MNPDYSRRDFIKGAALLPLAASGFGAPTAFGAVEPIKRVGGAVDVLVSLSEAAGASKFHLLVWREAAFSPTDFRKLEQLGVGKTVGLVSG